MSNYNEMKYNELQAACKDAGLPANGTKEELIERLEGAKGTEASAKEPEATTETENQDVTSDDKSQDTSEEVEEKPVITPQQEAVESRKADKALRTDAKAMKEALDKQRKVSIMIPFEAGEKAEQGKNIPFHINLNGYAMDLQRGRYIEVPEQIADVIKERLESEGKIGQQWRIDRDSSKLDALQG